MDIAFYIAIASLAIASTSIALLIYYQRRYSYLVKTYYKRLYETIAMLHKREEDVATKVKKLRRRYIVFTIISSEKISRQEIESALREKLRELYGIIGLARSDPQLVYYEPSLKRGVIRTSQVMRDHVVAALSLIREVNGKKYPKYSIHKIKTRLMST